MAVKKALNVLVINNGETTERPLNSLLQRIDSINVVARNFSTEAILFQLVESYPDLIFVEVDRPSETPIELFQLMKARNIDVPVVFIASTKEIAIHSIKSEVFDFLLKPVGANELNEVIEKYRKNNQRDLPGKLMEVLSRIREETKIRINSRYSYIFVDPSEVVFCRTEGGYTNIYLSSGKEEVASATLSQIEEMMKEWDFFRLSRSLLINLDYVRSVDKAEDKCILKSGRNRWELTASHKGINELLLTFSNYD